VRRFPGWLLGLVAALALVLACGGGGPQGGARTVKVAVLTTAQGPLAKQGEMLSLGAKLAAEEINAAGGVKGARLELVFLEGGCDGAQARAQLKRLVEDQAVAFVVGPLCSGAAHAIEEELNQADLPAVLPVASAEFLAHRAPVLFRMVPSDGRQAGLLALYAAREMGLSRVAVLYEDSAFGRMVRDHFGEVARGFNLAVVAERAYPKGAEQIAQTLRSLAQSQPEAILLAGDPEMGAVVARCAAAQGLSMKFLGPSTMADRLLLDLGGEAVEGFTLAEPLSFEPEGQEAKGFLERFQDRFQRRPTWIAAGAYDALGLAAQALERAGGGRAALRRELAAVNTAAKGYKGVSGLTFFDAEGGSQRPVRIVRVEKGAFVPAGTQFLPQREL
jgi:branched-chain amino acid transport system substrate-binding protein